MPTVQRRIRVEVDLTERTATVRPHALPLAIATGVLVTVAALYGLLVNDAYRLLPPLMEQTYRAQDAVNLAVVPLLLLATWRATKGSLTAHIVSVGLLTWLAYGYLHLAIGVPFTIMFLPYLAITGLAGFAMLDGLLRVDVHALTTTFPQGPARTASWFLAVAALGIAGLWLSEILLALPDDLPTNIHLAELPNPTWVLDLVWIIPLSLGAAWMLRRQHPAAPLVAGSLLVMLLVLSFSMLTVLPFALAAGLDADPDVAPQLVAFSIVFGALAACEAWLLALGRLRMSGDALRLRPGWWG